jgi:hypothetical protein
MLHCARDTGHTDLNLYNLQCVDIETPFRHKEISFRTVSKPGRKTAPGFCIWPRPRQDSQTLAPEP